MKVVGIRVVEAMVCAMVVATPSIVVTTSVTYVVTEGEKLVSTEGEEDGGVVGGGAITDDGSVVGIFEVVGLGVEVVGRIGVEWLVIGVDELSSC